MKEDENMMKVGSYSFGKNFKIFDNMLEGVSVYEPLHDDEGKITDFIIKYVNQATISGSDIPCEHYIGKYVSDLYGPKNLEFYFKMFEEIVATGKNKTFKAHLPPSNRYFQVSGFLTNEGLFVILMVDITDQERVETELKNAYDNLEIKIQEKTNELQKANEELKQEIKERKRIETELKESEEKFREIFNNANDMIALLELKENETPGQFIEINEVGLKRLGYSRDEFLKLDPPKINDLKKLDIGEKAQELSKKGQTTFETVHVTKDGKKIPIETNIHHFKMNGKKVGLGVSRDISERKKAENALKESEKRYRKLLENCFDAVVIHYDGKPISANNAAMKLLGVKSPGDFVNIPLVNFVHPDYRETVLKRIEEMVGNKTVPPMEEKFLSADGKVIDVEVLATGFPYKGKNAVQVVFRDITGRKTTENALKESEEKFRLIFNKANDMISLSEIKENGMPEKYIEVNEVGCKRLGYSREELLNMSPVNIIAPDKRNEMPVNAEVMAKNGCNNFEMVHITKNGKKIPVEVNGHRINYKGRKVYLTVSRDITKHKQMAKALKHEAFLASENAKALKESEEKFREIFNNANDMITLHEMNENGMPGQFIEVNEVGCKRLGYTNEEFQKMDPVDIVASDKRVEMATHAIEIWTNGYAKFEIVHLAKDGRKIPVEVNTHLFKFKGKTLALGVSRDMTAHKESEEKLNELLDKLSHLNEEIEEGTYVTAQYLQKHLESITNLTQQLKQKYGNKLDINIEKLINNIEDESANLDHMILNLLEYENSSRVKKNI